MTAKPFGGKKKRRDDTRTDVRIIGTGINAPAAAQGAIGAAGERPREDAQAIPQIPAPAITPPQDRAARPIKDDEARIIPPTGSGGPSPRARDGLIGSDDTITGEDIEDGIIRHTHTPAITIPAARE